jgi:hypothetical protein
MKFRPFNNIMFSLFERTVAFRYLRSPRQEGFVSVIAGRRYKILILLLILIVFFCLSDLYIS